MLVARSTDEKKEPNNVVVCPSVQLMDRGLVPSGETGSLAVRSCLLERPEVWRFGQPRNFQRKIFSRMSQLEEFYARALYRLE